MMADLRTRSRGQRVRLLAGWLGLRAALLLVTVLFGLPFLWTVTSALDNGSARALPWPREATLDHFRALFDDYDIGTGLRNSLIVAVAAMLLVTICASLAGYGLSRMRSRGKTGLIYSVLLLQTIPLAVTMVPIYDLASRAQLQDTYLGLILAHSAVSLPFLIWMMKGFTDAVPMTMEEEAWVDGATELRAWFDVVLPATLPGLAVVAGFAFVNAWSEVLMVVLLVNDAQMETLPFKFYSVARSDDVHLTAALGVLYVLPVVALFLALRRMMVKGIVESAQGM